MLDSPGSIISPPGQRNTQIHTRFDVYVCTAAERQYALEVWRLLDSTGSIILPEQRKARIVNVSGGKKKTLLHSLGLIGAREAMKLEATTLADDDGVCVWGGGGMAAGDCGCGCVHTRTR